MRTCGGAAPWTHLECGKRVRIPRRVQRLSARGGVLVGKVAAMRSAAGGVSNKADGAPCKEDVLGERVAQVAGRHQLGFYRVGTVPLELVRGGERRLLICLGGATAGAHCSSAVAGSADEKLPPRVVQQAVQAPGGELVEENGADVVENAGGAGGERMARWEGGRRSRRAAYRSTARCTGTEPARATLSRRQRRRTERRCSALLGSPSTRHSASMTCSCCTTGARSEGVSFAAWLHVRRGSHARSGAGRESRRGAGWGPAAAWPPWPPPPPRNRQAHPSCRCMLRIGICRRLGRRGGPTGERRRRAGRRARAAPLRGAEHPPLDPATRSTSPRRRV